MCWRVSAISRDVDQIIGTEPGGCVWVGDPLARLAAAIVATMLTTSAIVYGLAMILAGWWYVRNQVLYGDPLAWQLFLSSQQHMVRTGPYGWSDFIDFVAQIQRTYWGAFVTCTSRYLSGSITRSGPSLVCRVSAWHLRSFDIGAW